LGDSGDQSLDREMETFKAKKKKRKEKRSKKGKKDASADMLLPAAFFPNV
jgi:hypothetical protein